MKDIDEALKFIEFKFLNRTLPKREERISNYIYYLLGALKNKIFISSKEKIEIYEERIRKDYISKEEIKKRILSKDEITIILRETIINEYNSHIDVGSDLKTLAEAILVKINKKLS